MGLFVNFVFGNWYYWFVNSGIDSCHWCEWFGKVSAIFKENCWFYRKIKRRGEDFLAFFVGSFANFSYFRSKICGTNSCHLLKCFHEISAITKGNFWYNLKIKTRGETFSAYFVGSLANFRHFLQKNSGSNSPQNVIMTLRSLVDFLLTILNFRLKLLCQWGYVSLFLRLDRRFFDIFSLKTVVPTLATVWNLPATPQRFSTTIFKFLSKLKREVRLFRPFLSNFRYFSSENSGTNFCHRLKYSYKLSRTKKFTPDYSLG